MLLPSRRTRDLVDGLMIDPFETFLDNAATLAKPSSSLMKTDIEETDKSYELTIDLPGFKKDEVTAELSDGYLCVSASTETTKEERNEKGSFIRKERFSGTCNRKFFVGDDVSEDDIKAKFEDGLLKISVPKKEQAPEDAPKKVISIEG